EARVTRFCTELQAAPMLLDDSLNRIKPQTGTLPHPLGRKKWLINARLNFEGNSRTTVANLNNHATVIPIRPNSKAALAAHGVNRIVDDVGPNLIQFAAEGIHHQRDGLVFAFHSDAALELVVKNRERRLQALYDIDILHWRLVHESVFL